MDIFINLSNHPSNVWSIAQKQKAEEYGEIIDVAFPSVPADISEQEVFEMGNHLVDEIMTYNPKAVMCQGEFTLTFDVVSKLQKKGVTCLSACSERQVVEKVLPDGSTKKEVVFSFVRFRQYME